ncbi:MAG: carbon-phosphorus lyase complex subunit PhnI, partial [Methylocystaceae bacterium]|nr:carbon-phosphorus lyase complex subunit PhnI [Methylocystaceae bacterium]
MYVAVKGGEAAILATHDLIAEERRGDTSVPEVTTAQISEQMKLATARVMNEGSLYDPRLAALALKQAQGDSIEAAFLVRAYRTTLPRFGSTLPLDTSEMAIRRRISATYKDLPGGQVLGPTYDYTHRLFDFALMAEGETAPAAPIASDPLESH